MFLAALKGKNFGRPPVWLMRQAGRYLPEYRKYREKHSLRDLFFTPELAAQITQLPVDLLGVDAAILFSDITVTALALGYKLGFSEGPVITGQMGKIDLAPLQPVIRAIEIVKPELKVPLIGFCGAPFTVACYIPDKNRELLEQLTVATIEYIKLQVKAGVDAIQIFDSWAHTLTHEQYHEFCMPYLKRLVEASSVPVILFMKETYKKIDELVSLKPAAISFDWLKPLSEMRKRVPMTVQGNLDPDILYEPLDVVRQKTKELLGSMRGDSAFIANLGHGMKPDMSVDAVRCFVDTVKEFSVYNVEQKQEGTYV